MKIDDQENCEYRFSSIEIDSHRFSSIVIDFSSFIPIAAKNIMDKIFALFTMKLFITVRAHFPLT